MSSTHAGYGLTLEALPWRKLAPGLREKSQAMGEQIFRIVEFSDPFRESDWCHKTHTGYVIHGEIIVNVDGQKVTYRAGDVINLRGAVPHRHETTVATATLFLVEPVSSDKPT